MVNKINMTKQFTTTKGKALIRKKERKKGLTMRKKN